MLRNDSASNNAWNEKEREFNTSFSRKRTTRVVVVVVTPAVFCFSNGTGPKEKAYIESED